MELELADEKVLGNTNILVVGCGGGGGNTVNRMIDVGVKGIQYMVINTDYDMLEKSKAEIKVLVGKNVTNGLGAGGVPDIGRKSAEEDSDTIKEHLKGVDMAFITAGMGGGTGTGSAPVVARIAKEQGCLTVAIVTLPFLFERNMKMKIAKEGIDKLKEHVDILIQIPNENIFKIISDDVSIDEAFLKVDGILQMGIQGISDIINKTGNINIDFADVRTVMKGRGDAIMGIGKCSGKENIEMAIKEAVENPLLGSVGIDGAKALLVNFISGKNMSMTEFKKIMESISSKVSDESIVISGQYTDESLKDELVVTVIATGVNSAEKVEEKNSEEITSDKTPELKQVEKPENEAEGSWMEKPGTQIRSFKDMMWRKEWEDLKGGRGISTSVPSWEGKIGNKNQDLSYPTVLRGQQVRHRKNDDEA
ncbi:MAG: cell division protein FtsZ [Spirochaeta sp. LUC14_002_19_P3]|nr:MAG: cell division protein FtsZ [Spirochaeta sp. LUC14_002_19_P3]